MPIKYEVIIRMIEQENKHNYRYEMVRHALQYNVSAAAKEYKTTRITVRKWKKEYLAKGIGGLKDKSRAPHNIPHKMSKK